VTFLSGGDTSDFRNLAALTDEMGHTGSPMLFKNYRPLVRRDEAAKYWGVRPAAVAVGGIVPIVEEGWQPASMPAAGNRDS